MKNDARTRHHGRMLSNFAPGNYRSLIVPGRPFSDGVVADAGFDLVRAVLYRPLPLYEGLDARRPQWVDSTTAAVDRRERCALGIDPGVGQ